MSDTRSKDLEALAEETLSIMKRCGFKATILNYPQDRRSIDIAGLRGEVKVLIKVTLDTKYLRNVEYEDLKKAALAYEASPIIISEKVEGEEIESDVVVKKKDLNVVPPSLFQGYLSGEVEPLVYKVRGTYLVKINSEKFREKRVKELKYSLGELAKAVGVSRKTIYEYERGKLDATLDVAIRLAELMSEDIFQPIDLLNERVDPSRVESDTPQNSYEKKLIEICRERIAECKLYKLVKTPIDYIVRASERAISIIRALETRDSDVKINEGVRMSELMQVTYIVDEGYDPEELRAIIKRALQS